MNTLNPHPHDYHNPTQYLAQVDGGITPREAKTLHRIIDAAIDYIRRNPDSTPTERLQHIAHLHQTTP